MHFAGSNISIACNSRSQQAGGASAITGRRKAAATGIFNISTSSRSILHADASRSC